AGRGAAVVGGGPGEPGPAGAAEGGGGDAPLGRESGDDVKPAAAAGIGGRGQPGPAVVGDLDTKGGAEAAFDADGEGSAGPAGAAVQASAGNAGRENGLASGGQRRAQACRDSS